MKIMRGELDAIIDALNSLGQNRLPLKDTVRLHNMTKPFRTAATEREELRLALVTPYLPEGKNEPDEKDLPEVTTKIQALYFEKLEIEVEPFDLSSYTGDGKITLDENSLSLLVYLKLVKITPDEVKPAI